MAGQERPAGFTHDYLPDLTPVLEAERAGRSEVAGASVSTVLSQLGETLYEWDLDTDRVRWADNAGAVLGLSDIAGISRGRSYAERVDPDSLTDRHQAVLNGIGVDRGQGVFYDITYALRASDTRPVLWVQDYGLWFADQRGKPYLARGIVRLLRDSSTKPGPFKRALPRRSAFLRILDDALEVTRHYRMPFAFAVIAIEDLEALGATSGPNALERVEQHLEHAIRGCLRSGDPVGWLSDHELGVALRLGREDEIGPALQRIVETLAQPARTDTGWFNPEIVAGGLLVPHQADTLATCIGEARRALKEARESGAGTIVISGIEGAAARS